MLFTSCGLVSGVFRFSGDMLSSDVVSWIQIRYLRRDERTNYHHLSHQSTFSLALLLQ